MLREVFRQATAPLVSSISATTRKPRPGEADGVDYHFLTPDEFARRREAGEFLECCEVYGRGDWYGTLRAEVAPRLAAGKWVVLEIDVQGTLSVLEQYQDAVTIFLRPSSMAELERRLRERGTEAQEALERRLAVAAQEMKSIDRYRFQVTNDDVSKAVAELCRILTPGTV